MASWLKGQFDEVTAAVKKTVTQTRNQTFLDAVIAAYTMVAYADGVHKPEEKAKLLGFIEFSDALSVFDAKSIERQIEQCERQYAFDHMVADASMLQTVGKLKSKESEARLLVRICIAVGAADGDFDLDERAAVVKICNALGLNPNDFDLTTDTTTPASPPLPSSPAPLSPPPSTPKQALTPSSSAAGMRLERGGRVSLTKKYPTLATLRVGLGWNDRNAGGPQLDIDTSAFLLGANGAVRSDGDFIFYNQPRSTCGSIEHCSVEGSGEDKEVVVVYLGKIPADIQKVCFTVTIHEAEQRGQRFSQLEGTFIRLVDNDSQVELVRYEPSADAADETAMIFGELYRHSGEWRFAAVGQGYVGGLKAMCDRFGVVTD